MAHRYPQVMVLLSGASYIAYLRHLKFVPHDFEAELQKMIESGLIKVHCPAPWRAACRVPWFVRSHEAAPCVNSVPRHRRE